MKVKLYGVRGSIPAPARPEDLEAQKKGLLHGFFRAGFSKEEDIAPYLKQVPSTFISGYGGNTLCVGVSGDKSSLLIDGGSGIRQAGYELMAGPAGKGKGEIHIFFTHFHWDHLLGIPFFVPLYIPGNVVHIYCTEGDSEGALRILFKKPFFPVPYENLGAKLVYHQLAPRKPFAHGDLKVTPYRLDHPDPCWGYRVEHGGRAYAHCVDTECKRYSKADLGPDLGLYQNADVMLFDAQYTLLESMDKVDWGHSTANLGLDIAMNHGVKRVVFTHHDPAAADRKVRDAERQTREYHRLQVEALRAGGHKVPDMRWFFAREGMILDI